MDSRILSCLVRDWADDIVDGAICMRQNQRIQIIRVASDSGWPVATDLEKLENQSRRIVQESVFLPAVVWCNQKQ